MQYHPQNHILVGGETLLSSAIFEQIMARQWTSFSDLSKSMTNNKALKGQPVLAPTVSENSLVSSFPHIT